MEPIGHMTPTDPTHRRDFVRALALGAIAAPALGADDPKPKPDAAKPESPKPIDEAEARMAIVVARFGKHAKLDDAARAAIRNDIAGVVRRGEALRKITLDNGDGPFPVFHPYRGPME